MTAPRLDPDALERLLEEATCRPWCVDDHIVTKGDTPEQWHVYEQCEDDPPLATCFHGRAEADARLIAAAVNALPALIAAARERYGRMCVNCGRTVPVSHPRHEPLPECVGPEGMAACTFDLTLDEAWQHWRQEAHAERQQREQAEQREARLRAALEELTAMVRGECPSLLNEDSGGNGALALEIDAALAEGQDG